MASNEFGPREAFRVIQRFIEENATDDDVVLDRALDVLATELMINYDSFISYSDDDGVEEEGEVW